MTTELPKKKWKGVPGTHSLPTQLKGRSLLGTEVGLLSLKNSIFKLGGICMTQKASSKVKVLTSAPFTQGPHHQPFIGNYFLNADENKYKDKFILYFPHFTEKLVLKLNCLY